MKVYETIISYLDKAIERIEFVSLGMADKSNNNAYRFLSSDNADGIQIPLCLYRDILGLHGFPLGNKQQEVVEVAEDLGEAWGDLFDAIGQRIRKSHDALEIARNACNQANESLIVLLKSKVGSAPAKNAKSVVRELNTAIANLSAAMRKELAGPEPEEPGKHQRDAIRILAVSLIRGYSNFHNVNYSGGVEAVHKLLWKKFRKLGLSDGDESFRHLLYEDKFKDADPADEDELRKHGLIK